MGKRGGKKADQYSDDDSNACAPRVAPHVAFYKGEFSSSEGTLAEVHAWKKDYKRLEENHAYIQWLFPNYFDSKFNKDSRALTPDEARIFREELPIAKGYVKSYHLFLDFLGLKLVNERSGLVTRVSSGGGRLRKALVQYVHNHLRMRRLLASLAVTGFRRYIVPLVAHLEWEILGRNERIHFARDVCTERPVLPELAKAASKSERPFLDDIVDFANLDEKSFWRLTKALPEDDVDSVFLRESDTKFAKKTPLQLEAQGVVACVACEGTGVVVVIGVCPLCDGLKVFT